MRREWYTPAHEGSTSITSGETIELALERAQAPSLVSPCALIIPPHLPPPQAEGFSWKMTCVDFPTMISRFTET